MYYQEHGHVLIAKINVITEIKKHTVLSETFSQNEMRLKYPLPQEFLNQKNPIIFQIVYSSPVKTYIFNVLGTVRADAPMTVCFTEKSINVIQQFLADVVTTKKKSPAA